MFAFASRAQWPGRMVRALLSVAFVTVALPPVALAQNDRSGCIDGAGATGAAACERAIRRNPGDAELHVALVDRFLQAARAEDAERVLQQALAQFPQNKELRERVTLVESHLAEQKFMQQRKRAGSTGKRSAVASRLDGIKCGRQSGAAALAACERLLGDDAGDSKVLVRKAILLAQLGRAPEARRAIEAARQAGASEASLRSSERLLANNSGTADAAGGKEAAQPAGSAKPERMTAPIDRRLAFNSKTGAFSLR